ncbi:isocitrate lyase/phosphoenolpyruvate mutase family protein [Chromobacterium alkanivorans]|uniref:isocitrate lyase/PEP mutase family protein n=1 Tax=Chromobacterium alkanivorans TaxID=1071719 RepID=UPI001966CFB8|nr:isocitrate lyase/phosphoenolpyruvate mutase family protein [Chromobacterium alkanivorans]MBN3002297.1 isocitrate lyase/phosphoenolpyruvate mutase family protein [Chromobacterium alkanivorans]
MNFTALHHQAEPLLMANVWDADSARLAEQAGYAAIGTSSAAIAALLGYDDGEDLSFAELRRMVLRLRTASRLPLSVDMEAGYGDSPARIVANLLDLAALGVAGVNLEDSVVRQGQRRLLPAEDFAATLAAVRAGLTQAGAALFLNIRTDIFLLGAPDARAQAIVRGRLYAERGADGLFVPGVVQEEDILAIAEAVPLPLNVMCMPALPDFAALARLGVKRISMGNAVHEQLQRSLRNMLQNIRTQQSFQAVFTHADH